MFLFRIKELELETITFSHIIHDFVPILLALGCRRVLVIEIIFVSALLYQMKDIKKKSITLEK